MKSWKVRVYWDMANSRYVMVLMVANIVPIYICPAHQFWNHTDYFLSRLRHVASSHAGYTEHPEPQGVWGAESPR